MKRKQRKEKIKLAFIGTIEKYMDYYQCSDLRDLAYWFYKEIEPLINTEPEDEWIPTKNADKYTNDYEPDGAGGMKVKPTEPEDGEKGLPKLIEEAHRLNNELTAVLIMLNKYKISAPSKE